MGVYVAHHPCFLSETVRVSTSDFVISPLLLLYRLPRVRVTCVIYQLLDESKRSAPRWAPICSAGALGGGGGGRGEGGFRKVGAVCP